MRELEEIYVQRITRRPWQYGLEREIRIRIYNQQFDENFLPMTREGIEIEMLCKMLDLTWYHAGLRPAGIADFRLTALHYYAICAIMGHKKKSPRPSPMLPTSREANSISLTSNSSRRWPVCQQDWLNPSRFFTIRGFSQAQSAEHRYRETRLFFDQQPERSFFHGI